MSFSPVSGDCQVQQRMLRNECTALWLVREQGTRWRVMKPSSEYVQTRGRFHSGFFVG
jgi:hypothetical protein